MKKKESKHLEYKEIFNMVNIFEESFLIKNEIDTISQVL